MTATAHETEDLLLAVQAKHSHAARAELVARTMPVVRGMVRAFAVPRCFEADCMQEGALGVLAAVPAFNPAKGMKFSTYAKLWVRTYVTRCMHAQSRMVRSNTSFEADVDVDALELAEDVQPLDEVFYSAEKRAAIRKLANHTARFLPGASSKMRALARDILQYKLLAEHPASTCDLAARHNVSRQHVQVVQQRLLGAIAEEARKTLPFG